MEVKMPATQLIYSAFYCTTLSQKVIITSIHFDSNSNNHSGDEPDQTVVFDCAEKIKCGVCSEWGRFRSYEWEKCSHPELGKMVSA
jgi:hypothetical protein